MTTVLQHEDGNNYKPDQVSVQYDGRVVDLNVSENGNVEASNRLEVEALQEDTGFFLINDGESSEDESNYVLHDRSVDEVSDYVSSIDSVDRLKELREKEGDGKNRKTAKKAIDDRIEKVRGFEDAETGEVDSGN